MTWCSRWTWLTSRQAIRANKTRPAVPCTTIGGQAASIECPHFETFWSSGPCRNLAEVTICRVKIEIRPQIEVSATVRRTRMLPRLIAGIMTALMTSHAASAQTPRERASLNGFEHRDATLDDGVRIHYLIGGAGPPVVLLHGYPETWYAWRKVMPQLAAQYTVIVPDLRGFGDSSRPAGGYDRKTMAGDNPHLLRPPRLRPPLPARP